MESNAGTLDTGLAQTHVKGVTLAVPSIRIGERTVITTGRWLKTAQVQDEELVEGDIVAEPESFVARLKASHLKVDVLHFAQKPPAVQPRFRYPFEWDNWAVIPITCYEDWWNQRLPQESRKNVRRAAKREVVVRTVPFTADLVKGIQGIYNETPVRQGKPFWHFGKDFETVQRENGTYRERSEFVGAFFKEELIGFIKVTHVDRLVVLMQILAKNAHADKRPMNALLAHTVQLSEQRGASHLVYGNYVYGRKQNSSLTEFKRRNGFEELRFPRYYIPLTARGRIAVKLGIHQGWVNLIPAPVIDVLLTLRSRACARWYRSKPTAPAPD